MHEHVQSLRVKVGKRQWLLAVVESQEPLDNPCSFLSNVPDEPDLLIISGLQGDAFRQWEHSVTTQCEEWETQFIKEGLSSLNPLLSKPCLVMGPQWLLRHFCDSATPSQQVPSGDLTPPQEELQRLRSNLELSEVPRFPEEGRQDPFGQNQQLLNDVWLKVAKSVGALARRMHDQQLTVMLPLPIAEQVDLGKTASHGDIAPQQTVIPLSYSPDDSGPTQLVREQIESLQHEKGYDTELNLIQRFLVTLAALPPDMLNSSDRLEAAELLEDLGYLFVSSNLDMEALQHLLYYFDTGVAIALIHGINILHGDLSLGKDGNILFFENTPSGKRVALLDFGLSKKGTGSLPTAWERAKDLALLKLQCSFISWEAVKLGYRFKTPNDIAEEVFKLI